MVFDNSKMRGERTIAKNILLYGKIFSYYYSRYYSVPSHRMRNGFEFSYGV